MVRGPLNGVEANLLSKLLLNDDEDAILHVGLRLENSWQGIKDIGSEASLVVMTLQILAEHLEGILGSQV